MHFKFKGLIHHLHEAFGWIAQKWPRKFGSVKLWVLYVKTRPRVIVCEMCGKRYQSIFGMYNDGTQGDECASSLKNGIIHCHYGSNFDTSAYKLTGVRMDCDPICDCCIERLVKDCIATKLPDCEVCGWGLTDPQIVDGHTVCKNCIELENLNKILYGIQS